MKTEIIAPNQESTVVTDRAGLTPIRQCAMLFVMVLLLELLDTFKGTIYYTKLVEKAILEYFRVRHPKIFAQGQIADETVRGAKMIERMAVANISMSEQPAHVQQRYERDIEEVLIRYGVNLDTLSKI